MKNLYKIAPFLFLLLTYTALSVAATPKEEKQKVFKSSFKSSPTDVLAIINKYGHVNISNHDGNEVSVYVTVLAWAKTSEKAQQTLDRVKINEQSTSIGKRFETQIAETKNGYEYFNSKEGFEVNYEIKIPKKINLEIYNKFGTITLASLEGKAKIEAKHGNLVATSLKGARHEITLAHGNLDIKEISAADIEMAHGNIEIGTSTSILAINSRHSNIRIREADALELDAAHGNIRIGTVNKFSGESSHGYLEVSRVNKSLVADVRHGKCEIELVKAGFDEIDIENAHGMIEVRFERNAKFNFEAYTSHASVNNRLENASIVQQVNENNRSTLAGKVNGGGAAKVRLSNQHAAIYLESN